ncbi:hypothetical protein [Burkholderia glumae]|uniref:hypothetical protein n=1 Tax=Burkholderia glumae TaxID=337 RepID=UPI0020CBD4BD|nr:hypothetical protein [Burkholderia glumae]MCQ0030386.1 hypothetical protein [Burkholderia glumae]MCQ0035697.1 hypothetical protein [Burkholderia glumae]
MADVQDVLDTVAAQVAGFVYPNGTGQPSVSGKAINVFPGWPMPNQIDADMPTGVADVSVYATPTERNTTRYQPKQKVMSIAAATLTLTAAGGTLQLGKRLQKIGAEAGGVRNVAAASKALDSSLKAVGNQAALAERNLRGIKGAIPTGKIGIEAELTAANVQAKTLATTLAGMRGGRWLPSPGGGGGGGGGAGRGGHGGRIHGGNLHFGSHGIGIGGVGMGLMSDALVPLGAAMVAGYVGKQFYESAKDLQTEHARFKLFGMDDAQNKSAFDFAHNLHAYATSENEAMHYMNEAQAVFRESGETGEKALAGAKMAAPFLAKMMAASSILSEESQAKLKHESLAMLRAVELQGGARDSQRFAELADFGFRMTQTSGGQVNWEQLRQMYRTGGVAVQRMGMDAIAELEPIIGEFKGGSFATAMRTAYNRMNGIIKLPNQAVHELIKAGIWDKSKVELNGNGGIKRFLGNASCYSRTGGRRGR